MATPTIQWYRTPVPQEALHALMARSNARGFLFVGLHFSLLFCTGALFMHCYAQGIYYLLPLLLMLHGMIFSFLGYAGLGHELNHRTVFKSARLNDFFFMLVSLLTWNNFLYFRRSHMLHHKYTVLGDLDGEVKLPQTLVLTDLVTLLFFDFQLFVRAVRIMSENARNIVKGEFGNKLFPLGSSQRAHLVLWARFVLAFHGATILLFLLSGHWQYILLINLAPFFFTFVNRLLAQAQHFGMQPNTEDYRTNTRTVMLHPFLAFLYWQMNYHVEHHMFPAVPFFRLKHLSEMLAHDLPKPAIGLYKLLREMLRIHSQKDL